MTETNQKTKEIKNRIDTHNAMIESLKIQLTSPPVDGEANKMCVKLLAKILSVSPSRIVIVSVHTGRNKIIRVEGINTSEFLKKIPQSAGSDS